jgi:hypothetical protein
LFGACLKEGADFCKGNISRAGNNVHFKKIEVINACPPPYE